MLITTLQLCKIMQTIMIHINMLHQTMSQQIKDPALEFGARENDKLTSDEVENDEPVNEYRAPVCETCLESIIPNYPVVNAQVKRSIRSPSERSSSV